MADEHKSGGKKAQGFAANPEHINKAGRPRDPIVKIYRDAIDNVITADEWAKMLKDMALNGETDAVKLSAINKLVELRAPGLKLPPIDDIGDADITYTINI